MKTIALTQGKKAIMDNKDYAALSEYKWCAHRNQRIWYAQRTASPAEIKNRKLHTGAIAMHREILNVPKGMMVDHKNGDGLDNRRENIRICTHAQNQQNSAKNHKRVGNLRYKGVCISRFPRTRNKWVARIQADYIGSFFTEIEAAKAYDNEAIKRFGQFAKLNFPLPSTHE